jgi:GNAT superfamily N-acetyltransferase/uncharacterized protein YndB with AHSA1/START domain
MLKIVNSESLDHLKDAKKLFQEYADSRPGDPALTDFPLEIAQLPGAYAAPDGCLLLAYYDNQPVGCVALHKWSEGIAEMKRLYVQPQKRGLGIGKSLVEMVINRARTIGYLQIRLDTIPGMDNAQMLYRATGFKEIPPYRYNPNKGTLFFAMQLSEERIGTMADIFHHFPIKASRQKVFQAISTSAGLDAWWTKASKGTPAEGMEYELWFGPEYDWRAVVSRFVPETEFELRMTRAQEDWRETRVGFQLDEKEGVTEARFYHSGWPEANEHYRVSCYCWAMYLRLLKRYVEHGEVVPYEDRLDV